MNSCLPTTSSTMNQPARVPPRSARQTACVSFLTRTPLACSMRRLSSGVRLTFALTMRSASGNRTCCACSTLRYCVANAGEQIAAGARSAGDRTQRPALISERNAEPQAQFAALVVLAVEAAIDDVARSAGVVGLRIAELLHEGDRRPPAA